MNSRRQFLMTVGATLIAGCALKGRQLLTPGTGTISGHVWDRHQLKKLGKQHHPVFLRQFRTKDGREVRDIRKYAPVLDNPAFQLVVVAKTYTDRQGYFEFKQLPPGHYYVQPLRGDAKFVMIHEGRAIQTYYAGFQVYQV